MHTDTERIIYLPQPEPYHGRHRRPTRLDRFRALFTRRTSADTPLADMFDEPGIDTTVPLAVAA